MDSQQSVHRVISFSAMVSVIGILLSGPIGVVITMIKPQPAWVDAATFAGSYHPVQAIPYVFGFLMIFGFTLFIAAALHLASTERERIIGTLAVVFAAAYAALIGLNYTIQIAFVPVVIQYHRQAAGIFTMACPNSIGWALEMFGYGFLGASTWLIAPMFKDGGRKHWIRRLLVLNGIVSLLGAAFTAVDFSWLMQAPGIISVSIWNLMMVVVMWLVYLEYRHKTLP